MCWAIHGALCAVLEACGLPAKRGIGTMLVAPDRPPNHGTTTVSLDGHTWLVDACIQHGDPRELDPACETEVAHPAYGVCARPDDATWRVGWRSPFTLEQMDCRSDSLDGDVESFRNHHERTRGWSPFNFAQFARVHRRGGVLLAARGERVFIDETGATSREPLAGEARLRFLIEELGLSEALARQVPAERCDRSDFVCTCRRLRTAWADRHIPGSRPSADTETSDPRLARHHAARHTEARPP